MPDIHAEVPRESVSLIQWAYRTLLGRAPDPQGERYWLGRLEQGLSREGFLASMMESDEFSARLELLNASGVEKNRWSIVKDLNCDVIIPLTNLGISPPPYFKVPARDQSVSQGILDGRGVYEGHIVEFLRRTLAHGDTFIDIGANFGYFTVLGSHLVGSSGAVVAFEPVSVTRRYCIDNVEHNKLGNVSLFGLGLWSEDTVSTVLVPATFLGGAYLLADELGSPIDAVDAGKERITCTTLDNLAATASLPLDRLKAIKMDIEGAEPFALDGMVQTLRRHHPILVMEVNRHCLRTFFQVDSDAIWQRLAASGYEILTFPVNRPSTPGLLSYREINGVNLQIVNDLDSLNALCPEDALIDIVAVSK